MSPARPEPDRKRRDISRRDFASGHPVVACVDGVIDGQASGPSSTSVGAQVPAASGSFVGIAAAPSWNSRLTLLTGVVPPVSDISTMLRPSGPSTMIGHIELIMRLPGATSPRPG